MAHPLIFIVIPNLLRSGGQVKGIYMSHFSTDLDFLIALPAAKLTKGWNLRKAMQEGKRELFTT